MSQKDLILRLLRWLKPYLFLALVGTVLGLGEAIASTYFAGLQKDVIDTMNVHDMPKLMQMLIRGGILISIGILVCTFGRILKAYSSNCMSRDFRKNALSHVTCLPLSKVDSMHSGDLVSRSTGDASNATGAAVGSIFGIIDNMAYMVAAFILLSRIHLGLTLAATLAGPLIFLSGRFFDKALRERGTLIQQNGAELRKFLQEDLQGMTVVRAFGLQGVMRTKFEVLRTESKKLNLAQSISRNLMWQTSLLANVVVNTACAVVVCIAAIKGNLTAGALLAFLFLVGRLTWPFTGLSKTWGSLQEGLASAKRVFEILDMDTEVLAASRVYSGASSALLAPSLAPVASHALEMKDVTFSYDGQKRLFDGLSLQVGNGEMVAVVGPSGAGKSTLAKLSLGLYMPTSGSVKVDGYDITTSLGEARSHSSYVPQVTHVFAASIRENIDYGRPGATDEEIWAAIKAAGLLDTISALEEGLDAMVGEKGVNFSGGQKQRLALARALLRNPSLVVLDEATSSLDNETEASVQESIERLKSKAGVLVIAHRLTTVLGADRILVLDGGRIVEEGTHSELVAADGVYARLWSLAQKRSVSQNEPAA